ncbi:MAG: methyl-accepting chemotaxis protein [Pseudomonadota bacterium]|nr:methyl-accepting chemotaxis protein [Pseudomonadota bacterium]
MAEWTVRKRIVFGFATVILTMAGLGIFAFVQLAAIEAQASLFTRDSLRGLYLTGRIESLARDNYGLILQHILANTPEEMGRHEAQIRSNQARLEELFRRYEETITDDRDRELFSALTEAYRVFLGRVNAVLEASSAAGGVDAQAVQRRQIDEAFGEFLEKAIALSEFNRQAAEALGDRIVTAVVMTENGIVASLLLGLLLALACGYFLVRAIDQPLAQIAAAVDAMRQGDLSKRLSLKRRDEFGVLAEGFNRLAQELEATQSREQVTVQRAQGATIKLNSSSTSLAASLRQQEATITAQAASSNQIAASAQEISATSRELMKTMDEVTRMTQETGAVAEEGRQNLERLNGTMQRLVDASAGIIAKLQVLSEKAGHINTVVSTITKVADQTNLLSLNAAIEAEKAGEYGRGFSVVATEIRRLADQTAVASWDIEQMLKEMQSAVSASVMGMDKFSEEVRRNVSEVHQAVELLGKVIEHSQALPPRFESVYQSVSAQTEGAQQISTAMVQFNESMQQTSESLHIVKDALHVLNEAAVDLQAEVARFQAAR